MTHDEIRALLPAYAAGELGTAAADAVRAHLAQGCADCLAELFRLPVGLPLPATGGTPRAVVPEASARRGTLVAVVVLAAALVGLVAWTILDARGRVGRAGDAAARLAELEGERAALAARVEALRREVETARRDAAERTAAADAAGAARLDLEHELEAAQTRIDTLTRGIRRRDTEIDRLLAGLEEQEALRTLVASPGVQMLMLEAVAPFEEGRGHVLWHPAREALVLYAFDLPSPPPGTRYRVRLGLDDGRKELGPAVRPGPRGDVALPLKLPFAAGRLRSVEVVLDPAARPVLAGRMRRQAG